MSLAASVGMPCCSVIDAPDGVVGGALDVARRQVLRRHAAPHHPPLKDFPQRVILKSSSAVSVSVFSAAVEIDRGARALEVVPLRHFLAGLVDGVVDLLEIDAGGDVERRCVRHTGCLG